SAPARLDWAKLNHLNNHYIRLAEVDRLLKLVVGVHESREQRVREADLPVLQRTIPLVRDGAKTVLELADATGFVLKRRPLELPEKALAQLDVETRERLARLRARLAEAPGWEVPALTAEVRAFADAEGVGIGKFGPALRAVLSGGAPAPDLASALCALGKSESLGRLDDVRSPVS